MVEAFYTTQPFDYEEAEPLAAYQPTANETLSYTVFDRTAPHGPFHGDRRF